MVAKLGMELSYLYKQHRYLLQSERMSEDDKEHMEQMIRYRYTMPVYEMEGGIRALSQYLYQHHGQKPIILIDEYDAPLLSAYLNGYFDRAIELIRGIFAGALKTNDCLGRAILTSITRISKESLFSDLNNLVTVGMLDNAYADRLGFTEEEVETALAEFALSNKKDEVKKWYDGYTIGNQTGIYNPWSIIHFLNTSGEFDFYWSQTSGDDLIRQLLMEGEQELKQKAERLFYGDAIPVTIRKNVLFQELDMRNNETAVWTLLISTGYLRIVKKDPIRDVDISCIAKATNYEILQALKHAVRYWFQERTVNYNPFVTSLLANNLEDMNLYLSALLKNCMSSHDGGRSTGEERIKDRPDRRTPENFYHGLVLGLLVDLQDGYALTSNRESRNGRYDIMLEPLRRTSRPAQTALPAYIIEFKVQSEATEKNLDETADNALKQIEEKGYETSLLEKGFAKENIYKYGMAFNGKSAHVKLGK